MPGTDVQEQNQFPTTEGYRLGFRQWPDGLAGRIQAARMLGYSSADLAWRDLAVNTDGELVVNLEASSITIGKVDQGAGAAAGSPWSMRLSDGAAFYKALTDTELRASPVPVSGPLTDAQLRATPVPVDPQPQDLAAAAPANVAVGITSGAAVAASGSRKGLVLTNVGAQRVSLGLDGAAAVLDKGITLFPNGVWVMDEFTFTTGAVAAIAATGGSTLAIQELT